MRSLKRWILCLVIAALAAVSLAAVAACGSDSVTLTFHSNGGSEVAPIVTSPGESVELPVPVKDGSVFTGWYLKEDLGGEALAATITAPEEDTDYYAGWKAEADYTVYVYLQNPSGTGYRRGSEIYRGKGYAGESYTPDPSALAGLDHFIYVSEPERGAGDPAPVTTRVLSANAGENIFYLYFDRAVYTVRYDANLPAGSFSGTVAEQRARFESMPNTRENAFSAEGYRFVGWSLKKDGVANEDIIMAGGRTQAIVGPTTLYAVWDKAYTDRAGSSDLLYFPRLEPNACYMQRGGYTFAGTREGDSFTLTNKAAPAGDVLKGKVGGEQFAYENEALKGEYILYDNYAHPAKGAPDAEGRYDASTTLTIDGYLTAVYKKDGKEHAGELAFDATRGDYLLTFADNTESIFVRFDKLENAQHPAIFSIAGEEAGYYVEFLSVEAPYPTGDVLVFDGYGGAVLYAANQSALAIGFDGTYYIDSTISGSNGQSMYRVFVDIVDAYGMLASEPGEYVNYVMTVPLDTAATGEEFSGYVTAGGLFRGLTQSGELATYEVREGGTLFLDGLGYFDDSAVYRDAAGNEHKGRYTYIDDSYSGFVVTVQEGDKSYSFQQTSSTVFSSFQFDKPYREYRRMTDKFDYPAIVLFGEEGDTEGEGEIWISLDDGTTARRAGVGTYTAENSRGFWYYTFTVTQAEEAYSDLIPHTIKFYTTEANRSSDMKTAAVYIPLEEDGEKLYEEYALEGGGVIWANVNETLPTGLGSIWLENNTILHEGSFRLEREATFGYTFFTFTYAGRDGSAVVDRYVEDGNVWALREGETCQLQIYKYTPAAEGETGSAEFVNDLILDAFILNSGVLADSGNARYDFGTGTAHDWREATYALAGKTQFDENIYSLKVGGTEIFTFVVTLFTDANGNSDYIYFKPVPELMAIFRGEDGGTLQLDGYYWAEYIDGAGNTFRGTYSSDPESTEIYFTPIDGDDIYIEIDLEKGAFYPLDYAHGVWTLIDYTGVEIGSSTAYYFLDFDGRGNVSVRPSGSGETRRGTYEAIDPANNIYLIKAEGPTPGLTPSGWRVQLYSSYEEHYAILFSEETEGTFVNENWDVLWLDGFGGGTLNTADGSYSGIGAYSMLDEEAGFMLFMFGDETSVYLLLDSEKETFRIIDYKGRGMVFFADDLDYLAFAEDGTFQIGAHGEAPETTSGAYYFDEQNLYMVFYDLTRRVIPLPTPTTQDVTVQTSTSQSKTFHGWQPDADGKLRIGGNINFTLADVVPLEAELRITVRLGANYNNALTVAVKEGEDWEEYEGFILNIYTDGAVKPRIEYEGSRYQDLTFTRTAAGWTFALNVGKTNVAMPDYYNGLQTGGEGGNGNYTGGEITKTLLGFGPIYPGEMQDTAYSGTFLYGNKTPSSQAEPVTFENISDKDVRRLGYRSDLQGDLLEITFEQNGKKYAIDFVESYAEEVGACYILWGFYTYEERTVEYKGERYTVLIKYLIRATAPGTPGYGHDGYAGNADDLVGVAVNATLIKADGSVIEPVDLGALPNHDGVWLIVSGGAQGGYEGYLLTFKKKGDAITEIKLEIYSFHSAEATGGYLVYFLTDEAGNAVQLLAVYSGNRTDGFSVMELSGLTGADGTWTFTGKVAGGMAIGYTLTIVKDADGRYVVTVTAS